MRTVIVSDTHGELRNLRLIYKKAIMEIDAKVFIHLGDDYDDMTAIETGEIEVIKVPGIFSSHYQDKSVPNRIIREFEEWRFLISHTKEVVPHDLKGDINPHKAMEHRKADVLFYGHTHIPEIALVNGYIRINPGHLKSDDKRGYPPTYCVTEISCDSLDARIYSLQSGKEMLSGKFNKTDLCL